MNEPTTAPSTCLHTRFRVHAEVERYAESPTEQPKGFTVQLQVMCDDCKRRFVFDPDATIPGHDEPGAYINPEGWVMEVPIVPEENVH